MSYLLVFILNIENKKNSLWSSPSQHLRMINPEINIRTRSPKLIINIYIIIKLGADGLFKYICTVWKHLLFESNIIIFTYSCKIHYKIHFGDISMP